MRFTLLDAAMGTALLEAGLPMGALPETWVLEHPDRIARVHAAHASAGAAIVLTCTFNLAGIRLREAGISAPVEEIARRAVALARAAAPRARIAGAVGPGLAPVARDEAELLERHRRACRALAAAGVDLLWAESHWDLGEARVAVAAARDAGLPVAATFTFRDDGARLSAGSGEDALACLEAVARDGAVAVGANCSLPGAPLAPLVAAATGLRVPIIAKPAAGMPGAVAPPLAFAGWIADLARAGAAWVGGCCGTSAAHLRACADAISALPDGASQPRG